MEKLRILIVEDEPIIADDIAMILEKNQYHISDIVDNASEACAKLSSDKIDLTLLDINIEGDRDGISLAHQINKDFQVPFVFLTSYYDTNTLIRAKATNPQGYVVKPFDEGDLIANIELARLKSTDQLESTSLDKFFVRDRNELKALKTDDILYVEGFDNYANIYAGADKHLVSHTLKSVAEKLEPEGFVRVHKSYLVNFRKITSISEGYVFINELKIPIGRTYRQELLKNISVL